MGRKQIQHAHPINRHGHMTTKYNEDIVLTKPALHSLGMQKHIFFSLNYDLVGTA